LPCASLRLRQVSLTGLRGIYESVHIVLLGRHQAHNAAVAVGAGVTVGTGVAVDELDEQAAATSPKTRIAGTPTREWWCIFKGSPSVPKLLLL